MASHSREAVLKKLKLALCSFRSVGQKIASHLPSKFEHSSRPVIIDDDDLKKLKEKVDRIRAALELAEKLPAPDAFDELWMRELRDLLYRAEDVLEDIEFESVQIPKLEDFNFELVGAADEKRKREELTLLFYSFPRKSIGAKIGKIMEMYKAIASDRAALRLDIDEGVRTMKISQFPPSSSLVVGMLHGREEEFHDLHQLVLDLNLSHFRSYVIISLVGMPGIGKTAVVQHLCNDEIIKRDFKYVFWVCASQCFDVEDISRVMLEQSGGFNGEKDLSFMHSVLKSRLEDKRILLVMDDVWVDSKRTELPQLKSHWETMQALLNHTGEGSKVIFTTQNMEIAKNMGSDKIIPIGGLSDDHWCNLCEEKAFSGRDANVDIKSALKSNKIIEKCKCLPRAAKAIGEFLHSLPAEQMVDALHNLWVNDEPLNEILSYLRVSYDRLPAQLRRCFVYCCLFPMGYVFEKKNLVQLWVAQGFVKLEPHKKWHLEDVGGQYFDELVSRFLLQQLPVCNVERERYMMHDLLHDLAQLIASEEILRIENNRLLEISIDEKVRHLSLVPPHSDYQNLLEFEISKEKYMRTFLFCNLHGGKPYHIKISSDMFWFTRSLRALNLSHTNIKELPTSFNQLIHLRCLSLRKTKIEKLPESICGLFMLQSLDLKHCYALNELPQGIKYLVQLCHLELPKQKECHIYVPCEIAKLHGLRKLPVFIIGNTPGCCGVLDLEYLVDLQEKLHILGLQNVTHKEQSESAFLKNKLKLRKLKLQWSRLNGQPSSFSPGSAFRVFEDLKPNVNLQELIIRGYSGVIFPDWVGDQSFTKLVRIHLKDCGNCEKLPSLGQLPILKYLTIQLFEKVQNISSEFCGRGGGEINRFPLLETLELRKMFNLEEWTGVEEGDFPHLQNLILSECRKLNHLPKFNSVKTMVVQHCEQLICFPRMASISYLKLEGFENKKDLPELSNLASLEKLEVVGCRQLSGLVNIEHLIALQQFKVVKCPAVRIPADERLPVTLQVVHIGADCQMLSQWKPVWFEEVDSCDEECRKLMRKHTIDSNYLVTGYDADFTDSGYYPRSNERTTEHLLPSLNLVN